MMTKPIFRSLTLFLVLFAALNDVVHCDECNICSGGGEVNPDKELTRSDFGEENEIAYDYIQGCLQDQGRNLTCGIIKDEFLRSDVFCGELKFLAEACECPGTIGCDITCPEGLIFDENHAITDTLTCSNLGQTGSLLGNLCNDFENPEGNYNEKCCLPPQKRSSLRQADLENTTDPIGDEDVELVECSICPNGWPDEDRVILGMEDLTCGDIVTIGSLSEEVCAEINEENGNIDWACGCPGVERPPCTACPDGMSVLNLENPLTELGNLPITCAQAEEMAALRCSDNESDNQELQAIVAEECGCGYASTVPPVEPPSEEPVEPPSPRMADGAIVGIVIGAAVLELVILAVYFSYRRKKSEESDN